MKITPTMKREQLEVMAKGLTAKLWELTPIDPDTVAQ